MTHLVAKLINTSIMRKTNVPELVQNDDVMPLADLQNLNLPNLPRTFLFRKNTQIYRINKQSALE